MALHASLTAIFCLFYFDTPWNPLNKVSVEVEGQKEKLAALEGRKTKSAERKDDTEEKKGEEKEEEEEEDIQIPDEMPEDATFIPLGFAKQLPQTFYKGTDPEWQSFIEFSKDKKRSQLVRSMYYWISPENIDVLKSSQMSLQA